MELDVRRLMVLRAVRDAGGVLAAAGTLHVSPSAVSQQLSKLEHETGLALVARTTTGRTELTTAGVRLAERADAIDCELRGARRDLAAFADSRSRTVVVGGFPSAVTSLVVPVAARLRRAVPAVDVRVVETRLDADEVDLALRDGELDLALVKQERVGRRAGIDEVTVCDDPYRVVIPESWPVPAAVSELLDRPWVAHPVGSPGRIPLERIERDEGQGLLYAHECTEYPVALALVRAGLAAAVVPAAAIETGAGLRVLEHLGDLGCRRIAARRRVGETSSAVAAVLDALRGATVPA